MRAGLLSVVLLLALAAPAAAAAPQLVKVDEFDHPMYVASPPGDQQIFVVEKRGTIKLVGGGTFLDISSLVLDEDPARDEERGLLSMAFSPNYASNGLFYVVYTAEDPLGAIRVIEYRRSASNPNVADPSSARQVFGAPHDAQFHNGGQLQFGPDGGLYLSIGDAQHDANAQDLSVPYGKIIKLDLAGGYTVWSYGLRNPWRFSFDRATNDLIIGDVGDASYEEIDWAPAPGRGQNLNFGWPCMEGTHTHSGTCNGVTTGPAFDYSHSDGCAVVGGYVVRDAGVPTLNGRYIYGDNCGSHLRSVALPHTGDREESLLAPGLTSFGEDTCGHVYVATFDGPVYRLQDGAVSPCSLNGQATDQTPPTLNVKLSGLRKALRKHRLKVAMRCSERCSVTVGTRLKKVRKLKARHRDLAANHRAVVTVRLSKSTLKQLRTRLKHHRSVRVSVAVRGTDAAGNSKTVHRGGRIRRHG